MTHPQALDPWLEGYLAYLLEVRRQARRTVVDVRCTLKRAAEAFEATQPGVALWELALVDFPGSGPITRFPSNRRRTRGRGSARDFPPAEALTWWRPGGVGPMAYRQWARPGALCS
jgi:hypothetical protein